MNHHAPCSAIILAGGRASRMHGADKGLLPLAGKPLLAHVLARVAPQVGDIVISANRHADAYREFGWPVVADTRADFPGPLAGVLAALPHCHQDWVLVVPCDCPLLPLNLAAALFAGKADESLLAVVHDGERLQPLCLLLHRGLEAKLREALALGHAKVERWIQEQTHSVVKLGPAAAFDNINTPEQLQRLDEKLRDG